MEKTRTKISGLGQVPRPWKRVRRFGFINLILLLLVNFLWAAQFPAYKIASEQMGVIDLNFWTFVVGILILGPLLIMEHRRRRRAIFTRNGEGKVLLDFLLLGTVGIIPPSVFLSWGIDHSTASNAAIISLVIPVLTALMAVIMLGERITKLCWLSFGMAIVGVVLMSGKAWRGAFFNDALLAGDTVVFIAWMGSAFYNTYSKGLLAKFSELEVLVYGYIVACTSCAVLSLVWGRYPFYRLFGYTWRAWGAILVLGGLSWGIAMVMWMWVLKQIDVSQISVSIYLLPLFGVILSAVTVHERLTTPQLMGGALVLVSTFLTSDYERRRQRRVHEEMTS